jgi:hypothetical protein
MRKSTLGVLLSLLLVAWPALAQEQRGSIEGTVKDNTGAVLPGVTVEAKNVSQGGTVNTTTDANGVYRFPSLGPGNYEVTATLSGFSPAKLGNIEVRLGQVKSVELTLKVGGVSENLQVTAEAPLIDVKQNSRQTNISGEKIELVPHGRDFTTLVTQAAGANNEQKMGGLSVDGASAAENRYIINGVETTQLVHGTSGQDMISDFVEEVQLKSSGYTAEYGGAMGGVVNVVTKSGTNQLRGLGLFSFQGSATEAHRSPTLRISLTDQNQAEHIEYPEDSYRRFEPAISLGGPIAQNKAWFWGAYQPVVTPTSRTVTLRATNAPVTVDQKNYVQGFTGNVTNQISDSLRTRVSYLNSWNKQDGLLPALDGTDVAGTNYAKTSTYPVWSLAGQADWVISPKMFVSVRGGYFLQDQHDSKVTEQPQFVFRTSNVGFLDVPASLQHPTGFNSIPSNQKVDFDKRTRAQFQADSTIYGNMAGAHQIKFGVQLDRIAENVLSGNARQVVRINWNTDLSGARGTYGYYEVRSNAVDHSKGIITQGDIHSWSTGLFVQDAWTINNKLTINAGLRTENEKVPTYQIGDDIPKFGIEFPFKDKIAPRLGFAYDLKGDGRWKAFGSWGLFYDVFKLELPQGSFGGQKWISYYYTLDTNNWPTLADGGNCPLSCPGTFIRSTDFRKPSFGADSLEPDLKPMRMQEATFGLDHELTPTMAIGIHYVHKQLDRVVEDTGSLDADGNESYIIANPGEGLTELAFTGVALPKPKRDFDSVEVRFDKRTSNNWSMTLSYLWSRLYGNYAGLGQSDEDGRVDPNVGRNYDYPLMMFTGDGKPSYGVLATDRPSQFKAQVVYTLPFGTSLGANEYVASGTPVTREMGVLPTSNYAVQYLGRGSDGRTDMYSQTDFQVQHDLKFAGNRVLTFNFTVLNLFDQRAATSKYTTMQRTNGITFDQAAFYAGNVSFPNLINQAIAAVPAGNPTFLDPRFLQDWRYQSPRIARFMVKFAF